MILLVTNGNAGGFSVVLKGVVRIVGNHAHPIMNVKIVGGIKR